MAMDMTWPAGRDNGMKENAASRRGQGRRGSEWGRVVLTGRQVMPSPSWMLPSARFPALPCSSQRPVACSSPGSGSYDVRAYDAEGEEEYTIRTWSDDVKAL